MLGSVEISSRDGVVRVYDAQGALVASPTLAEFRADELAYTSQATSLAEARAEAEAKLAAIRWERTQTFTYDGVATPCNDGARAALLGAVVGLQIEGSQGPITWKLAPGEFRVWTLPELIAFGQAMRAHVQTCFDREAALSAQIEAARDSRTAMAVNLLDGWP